MLKKIKDERKSEEKSRAMMGEEKINKCPWCLQNVTQLEDHRRKCPERPTSSKSNISIPPNKQTKINAHGDGLINGNIKAENRPPIKLSLTECNSKNKMSKDANAGFEPGSAVSVADCSECAANSAIHLHCNASKITTARKQWSLEEKNE